MPYCGKAAVTFMYRAEDKYSCAEQEMIELESKLKVIMPLDFHAENSRYRVTSVYFDDYWDTCYQECLDGIQQRKKYRIRIYNGSFDTIKLEMKYKNNSRISKLSQSITYPEMLRLLSGNPIESSTSSDDVISRFNLAVKTAGLRPKIIIDYERAAYLYPAGNVRITLDRNIQYDSDIRRFLAGQTSGYTWLPDENKVLEIKYDTILPGFIARVLESGNMNQISFSKYKLCREAQEEYRHVI